MATLDMALDDVIKTKGGNSKRARGGARGGGQKEPRIVENIERPKRNTAVPGMAGAVKAAAAAAKAAANAASKPAVAATKAKAGEEKADKPATKPNQAAAPSKAPKGSGGGSGGGSGSGTGDKLGMALDDVIAVQGKKRSVTAPKASAGRGARGGKGSSARQKLGGRQVMRLRQTETKGAAKARTVKSGRKVRGRGANSFEEAYSEGLRRIRKRSEPAAWESGPGIRLANRAARAGKGGGRQVFNDDWGPPAPKRARMVDSLDRMADDWGSGSKGKGKGKAARAAWDSWEDDGWQEWGWGKGAKGKGKGYDAWDGGWGRPRGAPDMLTWDRVPAQTPMRSGVMDGYTPPAITQRTVERTVERVRPERVRAEPAEKPTRAAEKKPTTIRVCNVPKNLDHRDIKEAFEDIGRVTRCEVERGVATISFEKAADAKKAVQTFDRGELNGQTIFVSLESA
eukprot:TRINITY_DN2028_c0_g1_i1.p1 TRINITY_DN2028_c0_g1~~TRINITY_DN2028_c0_g1_i1.p1  ORF type:complete len:455 (+),score=117.12 TRINITY_DN2028_c0_g1_i1:74-1438(+)